MNIDSAIRRRASTRAFLDRPVTDDTIARILDTARWAPSGVNTQPWQVHVVTGQAQRGISQSLIDAREQGIEPNPDYHYYPQEWIEPYKSRRFECGMALYGALGIARDDKERRKQAWYDNYRFFGAPAGLMIFIDRRMEKGSWVDVGMFIQNIMLAALDHQLATCPQASLAEYPQRVRELLDVDEQFALVCGLSLGYPDPDAPVNAYRTTREAADSFTHWHD